MNEHEYTLEHTHVVHLDHLDLDEEDLDAFVFVFDTSPDGIEWYLNLLNPSLSSTSSSSSTSSDNISNNDDNNNFNRNSTVAKSIADIIQRVTES